MKKVKSTYEEFIEDPEQKALLEKEYQELLATENLLALREEEQSPLRELKNDQKKDITKTKNVP